MNKLIAMLALCAMAVSVSAHARDGSAEKALWFFGGVIVGNYAQGAQRVRAHPLPPQRYAQGQRGCPVDTVHYAQRTCYVRVARVRQPDVLPEPLPSATAPRSEVRRIEIPAKPFASLEETGKKCSNGRTATEASSRKRPDGAIVQVWNC